MVNYVIVQKVYVCSYHYFRHTFSQTMILYLFRKKLDYITIYYFPNMNERIDSYQVVLVVIVKTTYHQSSTMCQQCHVYFCFFHFTAVAVMWHEEMNDEL